MSQLTTCKSLYLHFSVALPDSRCPKKADQRKSGNVSFHGPLVQQGVPGFASKIILMTKSLETFFITAK